MIKIFASQYNGEAYVLSATGHAGGERNEQDHDLVCCAVSTLMGTLANSCAQLQEVKTIYRQTSGDALLRVKKVPADMREEVAIRFRMALDGLQGLAQQYPECLRVTEE